MISRLKKEIPASLEWPIGNRGFLPNVDYKTEMNGKSHVKIYSSTNLIWACSFKDSLCFDIDVGPRSIRSAI